MKGNSLGPILRGGFLSTLTLLRDSRKLKSFHVTFGTAHKPTKLSYLSVVMASTLLNIYHLRTVAETASKNCMICFKSTPAVLITPDNKDFFYVCRGHLKDKGFCTPMEDPEKEKREAALREETERLKKEYQEKLARKERKEKEKEKKEEVKDGGKDREKGKDEDKKDDTGKGKEKKEEEGKAESSKAEAEKFAEGEVIPRIYSLHRNFYQMRVDRIRKAEIAKRNRERLSNPSTFPSVPSGLP